MDVVFLTLLGSGLKKNTIKKKYTD